MTRMTRRLFLNFIMGYCVCSAVLNVLPVRHDVVPVVVFNSDGVSSQTEYRVSSDVPKLFDFNAQD